MRDVVAVIGIGRVGLPLALELSNKFQVLAFEKNADLLATLSQHKMPFHEPGYDDDLDVSLSVGTLKIIDINQCGFASIKQAKHVILSVGTPLQKHLEPDNAAIFGVLKEILNSLGPETHISFRSTLAPGTFKILEKIISGVRQDVHLTYCPERLSEGLAKTELRKLPQVIGARTVDAESAAKEVYFFAPKFHVCSPEEAELVKVFNNAYRYVKFATANQFALIAQSFGISPAKVIHMANDSYPRDKIPSPGFTAGTCLRKDFGFLTQLHSFADLFLCAWRVNEHLPVSVANRVTQENRACPKVLVVGITFKKDCDDMRDSHAIKLAKTLASQAADVHVWDPMLPTKQLCEPETGFGFRNLKYNELCQDWDAIVVGAPHAQVIDWLTLKNADSGVKVYDIWNCLGLGEDYYVRLK